MVDVNFRAAELDDVPQLLELEQSVIEFERPFNAAIKSADTTYYDLENLICSEQSQLMIGEFADKIVATGYVQIRESKVCFDHRFHAYLGFMFVAEEHRGKGLNGRIIERLISWAKVKGICDIYLDVYYLNAAAIKAYKKTGFSPNTVEMKLRVE